MDLSGNPYVIFPGDVPAEGYLEIRPAGAPVFIDVITWSGYIDAAHVCDLKDGRDRELFFRLGNTDYSSVTESFCGRSGFMGLRLYSLQSGQLYIYLR